MNFTGDARLLFFAHAFKVRRQFAQLPTGAVQLEFNTFALADIPDNTVPHYGAIIQTTGNRFDLGPALLALAGQNPTLP